MLLLITWISYAIIIVVTTNCCNVRFHHFLWNADEICRKMICFNFQQHYQSSCSFNNVTGFLWSIFRFFDKLRIHVKIDLIQITRIITTMTIFLVFRSIFSFPTNIFIHAIKNFLYMQLKFYSRYYQVLQRTII